MAEAGALPKANADKASANPKDAEVSVRMKITPSLKILPRRTQTERRMRKN
jgi:hypothetical protein